VAHSAVRLRRSRAWVCWLRWWSSATDPIFFSLIVGLWLVFHEPLRGPPGCARGSLATIAFLAGSDSVPTMMSRIQ
jgi:hypothetical protein